MKGEKEKKKETEKEEEDDIRRRWKRRHVFQVSSERGILDIN